MVNVKRKWERNILVSPSLLVEAWLINQHWWFLRHPYVIRFVDGREHAPAYRPELLTLFFSATVPHPCNTLFIRAPVELPQSVYTSGKKGIFVYWVAGGSFIPCERFRNRFFPLTKQLRINKTFAQKQRNNFWLTPFDGTFCFFTMKL